MKMMQLVATCDMTRAATGQAEPAAETVFLAFGTDARYLKVRELDLTDRFARELREFLEPWLAAGHEPGDVQVPGAEKKTSHEKAADGSLRAWNAALRKWAQANGYRTTKLKKGGYYYPRKTRLAYGAYMEGRDAAWLAAHGLQPDADPATGNSV